MLEKSDVFFFMLSPKYLAVDAESTYSVVTNFVISILNGFY